MTGWGHKHRISVLLSQPLCRNCLQYLPNFVHRSEATQVPAADITALRHKRAYRALRERKSTRDKCDALVGWCRKAASGRARGKFPTEGSFCVWPPALPALPAASERLRLSISVCFRGPTRDTGRRGRLCSGGANSDDGPVSRRHGGGVGGKRGWIHCDRRDRGCGQPLQAAVASGVVHLVERRRLLPCVVGCLRGPCHEGFTTQTFVNPRALATLCCQVR